MKQIKHICTCMEGLDRAWSGASQVYFSKCVGRSKELPMAFDGSIILPCIFSSLELAAVRMFCKGSDPQYSGPSRPV